jgi:hypothetical protein
MMAAGNPHPESFGLEQMTKFLETDIGVRFSAQNLFQCFVGAHIVIQARCASFAQLSFRVIVRLKTSFPGALSLSRAK